VFTSLVAAAPKILINAELGDSAYLRPSPAASPARLLGYDVSLHTIRRFREITAFGVTFAVADLYPVIERVLPARFGGGPGDYQLVEHQDDHGIARLRLHVDPSVGPLDPDVVRTSLLEAMSGLRTYYGFMAAMLDQAGAVEVRREPAQRTAAGKILPVVPGRARPVPDRSLEVAAR
jgi:hypothetical protein